MSKITQKCVECGKEFEQYRSEYRIHCSVGCQFKKYEEHPPECGWHRDWHSCSCGAFDLKDHQDDEGHFIPIPDEFIKKLDLKEKDSVHISIVENEMRILKVKDNPK